MTTLIQNGGYSTKLPGLGTTYTEISPTYISSDLLSPTQKDRITIPAIGYQEVQHAPLGPATWGEHVTGYGGIGKLPFLGRARTRDLDVTRSHKHYGSGFAKYETTVQPYRHTPLVISAGRINDQIQPPCFKEYLDPKKYNPSASVPKQRYPTHVCRNEVFPVDDAERTLPDGETELTERTRNALKDYYKHLYYRPHHEDSFPDQTEITKQYMNKKNINIEREEKQIAAKYYARGKVTVNHNDSKKLSHAEQITQCLAEAPGPRTLATSLLKLLEDATLKEILTALKSLTEQIKPSMSTLKQEERFVADRLAHVVEECIKHEEEGTYTNHESTCRLRAFLKALRRPPSGMQYHRLVPELPRNVSGAQTSSNLTSSRPVSGRPGSGKSLKRLRLSGVGACWPPSKSHVLDQLKMRLKEVERIPETVKHHHTADSSMVRNLRGKLVPRPLKDNPPNPDFVRFVKEWMQELNGVSEVPKQQTIHGLPKYKNFLNEFLPVKLSGNDSDTTIETTSKIASKSIKNQKVRIASAVRLDKDQSITTKPIPKPDKDPKAKPKTQTKLPPLASFLQPTGNRLQDRLGLSFKTDAHQRYHALYPDHVPDLRDSDVWKKRYFFYGFHGSAFRG